MAEYRVNLDVEALAEALFGPCRVVDAVAFIRTMARSWPCLTPRQTVVVQQRYGWRRSRHEAAGQLGLTPAQVQQAELAALRRLRHPSVGLRALVEPVEDA